MTKPNSTQLLLIFSVAAALFLLGVLMGKRTPSSDSELFKIALAAKDSQVVTLQRAQHLVEQNIQDRQQNINTLAALDSIMAVHYQENQKIYSILNEKLQNVPASIVRIAGNDDSIRSAYARFQ